MTVRGFAVGREHFSPNVMVGEGPPSAAGNPELETGWLP
jgi:hypothetical protein